jgi:hypothetical protein
MDFKISGEQLNNVGRYLQTKPWQEVEPLMHMLQELPKIEEIKSEEEKPENG